MVEGQGRDSVDRHPQGFGPFHLADEDPVDLHEGDVGDGNDPPDAGLLRMLEPVDVLGVLGPVFRAEGAELGQGHVLEAGQFGQDAPGGTVQFLVFPDQAAGQFHVMETAAAFFAGPADEQHFQALPVEAQDRTVDRKMGLCQGGVRSHQFRVFPKIRILVKNTKLFLNSNN